MRILEHPDVLLIAQSTAITSGSTAVHGQPETLDEEGEPGLGELGRKVP
jgi:hypothetical protein